MDSFELNKIIGAILGTLLFIMGAGFIAEAVYHPIEDRGPGYDLPEAEAGGEAGPVEEAVAIPIGTLLASANIEQGQRSLSKCAGCHNFDEGGANKQGPGLYDVVGRVIGSHEGFSYSPDLAALGAAGEVWDYQHLNDFLHGPKAYAPGTKMNFGGLKNDEERANVIAYLSTLSANPLPFPPPEPSPDASAEAGAPAGDAAAPAPEGTPAVATDAQAVETPTETQSDTAVEGTPVSGAAPTSAPATTSAEPAPATEATPPTEAAPAATEGAPATDAAPATETVGPGAATPQ